jgi:CubicO group peptidase (beta-lactamase class C family)
VLLRKLPPNYCFIANSGLSTEKLNVLGFTAAENVGMNPSVLAKIETVAQKAIDGKMAPGMQILVARKGKVIYQKSFGYQTYERRQTSLIQIYMMSLTKILSTLPNVMLQYDQQNIKMETTLGSMLPIFKIQINKTYTLRNCCRIMQPWIPFATVDKNGNPLDNTIKWNQAGFPLKWLTVFI